MSVLAAGGREESARPHKDPHVPLLQDLDPQGSVVDDWSFHEFRRHIRGELRINHFVLEWQPEPLCEHFQLGTRRERF
jgi:hypothetical protein